MKQYLDLLKDIRTNGVFKEEARENMPRTLQLFGTQMKIDLNKGFPLYTTKMINFSNIVHELNWFIKGHTSVKFLEYYNCRIWHDDSYVYYTRMANTILSKYEDYRSFQVNEPNILALFNSNLFTYDDINDEYKLLTPKEYKSILRAWSDDIKSTEHTTYNLDYDILNNTSVKLKDGSSDDLNTLITIATNGEYKSYDFGDCGAQYGYLWRRLEGIKYNGQLTTRDQFTETMVNIMNHPFSRRHIISSWNPATLGDMALNACHPIVQWDVNNNEKYDLKTLNCSFYMRSNDMFLGNPYNISFYALLTQLMAISFGYRVGGLTYSCGDSHIYENHLDAVDLQLTRKPRELPTLNLPKMDYIYDCLDISIEHPHLIYKGLDSHLDTIINSLESYDPHDTIKAELSVGIKLKDN